MILKNLIFKIKFSWISINVMKIQIDKSYYIGSIRRQNGLVFHIHAKLSSYRMYSPASYLVGIIYTATAIGVLKTLHK